MNKIHTSEKRKLSEVTYKDIDFYLIRIYFNRNFLSNSSVNSTTCFQIATNSVVVFYLRKKNRQKVPQVQKLAAQEMGFRYTTEFKNTSSFPFLSIFIFVNQINQAYSPFPPNKYAYIRLLHFYSVTAWY